MTAAMELGRRRTLENGFSLLELVVVVAIVGILASAVLPVAHWSLKRSREHRLRQNLRVLRDAIDRYHDAATAGLIEARPETGGYPPELEVLVEGVELRGMMPPIVPPVSDEYTSSGPGLTGGLGAQLQEGSGVGLGLGAGAGGMAPGGVGMAPGAGMGSQGRLGRRTLGSTGAAAASRSGSSTAAGVGFLGRRGADSQMSQQPSRGSAGSGLSGSRPGIRQGLAGGSRQLLPGTGFGSGELVEPGQIVLGPDGKPVRLIFLRRMPVDPLTGDADWGLRCYGEQPNDSLWCGRNVFDVYSQE